MKRILIAGAGSIGIRVGAQLHRKHENILLLGRKKLHTFGDFVKLNGEKYLLPQKISVLPKETHFDVIFICTKLHDTINILENIHANNITFTHIVAIQNGLVPRSFYEKTFLKDGLTTISIHEGHMIDNNEISFTHSSNLHRKINNSETGIYISKLLQEVGIYCKVSSSLEKERAKKLLLNTSVNGLSAIYKMNIGDLLEDKMNEILSLLNESYQVLSQKYDIGEKETIIHETIEKLKVFSYHFPTTYQDVIHQRKTEIEFINGYIVDLGKNVGINTPYNSQIVEKVHTLEYEYL